MPHRVAMSSAFVCMCVYVCACTRVCVCIGGDVLKCGRSIFRIQKINRISVFIAGPPWRCYPPRASSTKTHSTFPSNVLKSCHASGQLFNWMVYPASQAAVTAFTVSENFLQSLTACWSLPSVSWTISLKAHQTLKLAFLTVNSVASCVLSWSALHHLSWSYFL